MPSASDMKGKAALVTGAASGLGRATALALGRAGADLCIVDVNTTGLGETAESTGRRGCAIACCMPPIWLCATTAAERSVAAVQEFGRLDALCNVAGIIVLCNAHEMREVDFEKTLAVNLSAPFYLMQAAIPHLLQAQGAVVNVTSSAAFVGEAYAAAYCATKAGLTQMTKALAMEYVHQPIRFNAVAPGGMMTNIAANIKMPEGADRALISRFSGLRGMVDVADVADMIAFLASDARPQLPRRLHHRSTRALPRASGRSTSVEQDRFHRPRQPGRTDGAPHHRCGLPRDAMGAPPRLTCAVRRYGGGISQPASPSWGPALSMSAYASSMTPVFRRCAIN